MALMFRHNIAAAVRHLSKQPTAKRMMPGTTFASDSVSTSLARYSTNSEADATPSPSDSSVHQESSFSRLDRVDRAGGDAYTRLKQIDQKAKLSIEVIEEMWQEVKSDCANMRQLVKRSIAGSNLHCWRDETDEFEASVRGCLATSEDRVELHELLERRMSGPERFLLKRKARSVMELWEEAAEKARGCVSESFSASLLEKELEHAWLPE